MVILSYMATAVISASEAMHYAHAIWDSWPVIVATLSLLLIFIGITILGIGESSKVASVIFVFHLGSLVVLSLFCGWVLLNNGIEVLQANYNLPNQGTVTAALFFGFSAATLCHFRSNEKVVRLIALL